MRPRRKWTAGQDAKLRALYPDTPTRLVARALRRPIVQVYARVAKLGIKKTEEYLAGPHACRLRRGDNVGKATQFQPGHVPWSKGRKGWKAGGRSAVTRFRKGHTPQTWVPVGTEVVDRDGYRKRKVSDDRTKASRFNWRFVHRLHWERYRGPIPPGHAIVFRNGDKSDIRIANLECVSRAELGRRNSIHRYPPELVRAIQLRGALVRQIRRRER